MSVGSNWRILFTNLVGRIWVEDMFFFFFKFAWNGIEK